MSLKLHISLSIMAFTIIYLKNAHSFDISSVDGSKNYCGHLNFNTSSGFVRVDVSEGEIIPAELFQKIRENSGGNVYFPDEDKECQISVCGFARSGLFDYDGNCMELTLSQNFSYFILDSSGQKTYSAMHTTSISCGCPVEINSYICGFPKCGNRPLPDEETCAILYREHECHDCIYEEIFLKHGESFETKNSAVIRSFIVNPNCTASMRTYGSFFEEKVVDSYFNKSKKHIHPSYYANGETFSCRCPHLEVSPEPSDMTAAILASIILILIFLFSIVIVVIRFLKRKQKQFRLTLTDKEVEEVDVEMKEINEKWFGIPKYDPEQCIIRSLLQYENSSKKGCGNFGEVYEGTYNEKTVAVKTTRSGATINDLKALINEIIIMTYIDQEKNPNIVSFIGSHFNFNPKNTEVLYVMELCETNLHSYLKNERNRLQPPPPTIHIDTKICANGEYNDLKIVTLEEIELNNVTEEIPENAWINNIDEQFCRNLLKWAAEIANGMEYLNRMGVIHIDLAARNCLISQNNNERTIKICDFGLSTKLYEKSYIREPDNAEKSFPFKWLAIECLKESKFSKESDIWSFGVLLWELLNLAQPPYPDINDIRILLYQLETGKRLEMPPLLREKFNENIYENIMCKCWMENPESRPSFEELKTSLKNCLDNFEFISNLEQ